MSATTSPGPSGGDYDLSNPVGSFTDVVRRVVTRPVEFFSIPRRGNYLAPLIFALICIEFSTILGGLLRLAWQAQTMGGLRFEGAGRYGFGSFVADVILAPIGGAIGLFTLAAIAHLLVMLFVGEATPATSLLSEWSPTSR